MTTDVWQITTQSLEEVEKTIPLCSGSVQIIYKAAIIDAAQIVKIPQCHGIGFLGRFVLLYRDFINVADRRKARVGLGLQNHFELIIKVCGSFIVQLAFLFVFIFDDLDGFGAMSLEIGDAFAKAFKKLVYDVRVFFNKVKRGRDCSEPDHGQELHIDDLESSSTGEDIARGIYKRGVDFAVPDIFPLGCFAAETLNLAFTEQA